mgnify:CR=1 FL=1
MGFMIIDGRKVEFTDEKNILTVIRKAGIDVPTLCYHSELSTFGACRLCTVEDDRGRTFASCSEEPRDGMVIYTNSEPQADRRAFAGCTLQRLYDLYQERRVCTSGTGTPPRREKSTFPEYKRRKTA